MFQRFTKQEVESLLEVAGVNFDDVIEGAEGKASELNKRADDEEAKADQMESTARNLRTTAKEWRKYASKLSRVIVKARV